jgi:hypothetical protein
VERTVAELTRIERAAAFHRSEPRWRMWQREADMLLSCVEECRVRGYKLVPLSIFGAVVRLVARVDSTLRDELGINRLPDHVGDVLFSLQEELLVRHGPQREAPLAPVIPLFGPSHPETLAIEL